MDFTSDWFSHNIPVWSRILEEHRGKPSLRYLEIGAFEGRATCWLLENILTGKGARIDCIDTFEGGMLSAPGAEEGNMAGVRQRFESNISPWRDRTQLHVGLSAEILPTLRKGYDFVYIDGSHQAKDVLTDTILSWRLLNVGGIAIFDDYGWIGYPEPWRNPKLAIDAFACCFQGWHEILHTGYQVALRKRGAYTLVPPAN